MMIHLTNYSLNKHNNNFEQNRTAILDSTGHKRSLKYTLRYIRKVVKLDDVKLMEDIKDIIVKTCIAGAPSLKQTF
jgi:tubulin polyglutamylase TTLL7